MLRLLLAVSCAALLCAAAADADTLRPPDGTYSYTLSENGKPLGTSRLTLQASGSDLLVSEEFTTADDTILTETTLDGLSLRERTYRGSSKRQGQFAATIETDAVRLSAPIALTLARVEGTAGIFLSEGLIASYALLPAFAKAAGIRPLTDAALNGGKAVKLEFKPVPSAVRPPAGTPGGDVGLVASGGGASFYLWYNPATLVLDELDQPDAKVRIRLTSSSPEVAAMPTPEPVATPMPLPSARYASRDVTFRSADGVSLAGTLTIPVSSSPVPGVVLVHGSGAVDRDERIGPNAVFLQLANRLSNSGYAVLRYDKRGVGKSGGQPVGRNPRSLLLDDVRAAVAELRKQPEVDPSRIFVLGHSEGALLAPSVAIADPSLRGLILMGAPALPLDVVLVEQLERDATKADYTAEHAAAVAKVEAIKKSTSPDTAWFRSEFGVDPAQLVAQVPVPMLVLQGGKDVQVFPAHLPRLVAAAQATHRDLTVKEYPNDGHLLMQMPPSARPLDEYGTPALLDPAALADILAWLNARSAR